MHIAANGNQNVKERVVRRRGNAVRRVSGRFLVGSLKSLRSLRSLGIKNQTEDADAMNRVPTIEMIFDCVIGRI